MSAPLPGPGTACAGNHRLTGLLQGPAHNRKPLGLGTDRWITVTAAALLASAAAAAAAAAMAAAGTGGAGESRQRAGGLAPRFGVELTLDGVSA